MTTSLEITAPGLLSGLFSVTRTGKPWSPNNTVPGSTRPCCWGSFPRTNFPGYPRI